MVSSKLKALIVYDNSTVAKQIQEALPDYFECSICNYSIAKGVLTASGARTAADVIIMNADDKREEIMDFYNYLCKDPDKNKVNRIPVVLITKDEFSDGAMRFYDMGNPVFYSGNLEDAGFYMAVDEAIENAEMLDDSDFEEEQIEEDAQISSVSEAVAVDKMMGATYEVSSGEGPDRIASFNAKETLDKIARMVGKNKVAAKQVLKVLETTAIEKRAIGEEISYVPREERPKTVNKVEKRDPNATPRRKQVEEILSAGGEYDPLLSWDVPIENIVSKNNVPKQNVAPPPRKVVTKVEPKKVILVDTDPLTKKAFELFLGHSVLLEWFDSSMKAISYFAKNKADVVVVNYKMPNIDGVAIIKSIRMQPYGGKVKAAILMGPEATQADRGRVRFAERIMDIIEKPIVKKQMLAVINKLLW